MAGLRNTVFYKEQTPQAEEAKARPAFTMFFEFLKNKSAEEKISITRNLISNYNPNDHQGFNPADSELLAGILKERLSPERIILDLIDSSAGYEADWLAEFYIYIALAKNQIQSVAEMNQFIKSIVEPIHPTLQKKLTEIADMKLEDKLTLIEKSQRWGNIAFSNKKQPLPTKHKGQSENIPNFSHMLTVAYMHLEEDAPLQIKRNTTLAK